MTSRRSLLTGVIGAPLLAGANTGAVTDLNADLERYVAAGIKHSGGDADNAVGNWLQDALSAANYRTERVSFDVPYYEPTEASLLVGDQLAPVLSQPPFATTPDTGLTLPLVDDQSDHGLSGAIALVNLPNGRWSSFTQRAIASRVERAFSIGARACILITNGPSGEAIALNAPPQTQGARIIAVLAPRDAAPVTAAARDRRRVTLKVLGRSGSRAAFSVVGRFERDADLPWLALSTPRSGWTTCAAERGPGVTAWLSLARWAAHSAVHHNIFVVCNSGHEYENLGMRHMLERIAPGPDVTGFWLHLGANLASRDWHETPDGLLPLVSADPQRFLLVNESLLGESRRLFAGQAGLECPYELNAGAAGELAEIVRSGYRRAGGVFGAHRLHHTMRDTLEAVDRAAMASAEAALRGLISAALSS